MAFLHLDKSMRIQITSSAPDYSSVLSTADLKQHLRVTHSVEDALIGSLRDAACMWVEGYTNSKLHTTTATGYLRGFHRTAFAVGPVTAIASVKYQTTISQASEDLTTMATGNYYTDFAAQPAVIAFVDSPSVYDYSHYPVHIAFTYGYATPPEPMVHAVRLLAAHFYENRQQVITGTISTQIKMGIEALLSQYRNILQP